MGATSREQTDERLARVYADAAREELDAYTVSGSPRVLERAFAFARAAAAELLDARGLRCTDLATARQLAVALPELAGLAQISVAHGEDVMMRGVSGLWSRLSLPGSRPQWSDADRELARGLVLLALAAPDERPLERLGESLRRVVAPKLASALIAALMSGGEGSVMRLLGDRYEELAAMYAAPRGNVRGLAPVLATPATAAMLQERMTRWFALGGRRAELAAVVEACLAHTRPLDTVA